MCAGEQYLIAMEAGSLQPQDVSLRLCGATLGEVTLVKLSHMRLLEALQVPPSAVIGAPAGALCPQAFTLSVPLPEGVVASGVCTETVPFVRDGPHFVWTLDKARKAV